MSPNLPVMLAGFIVGMVGMLVGAVATFLYLQHSVKAIGFNVTGTAHCVECSNRCEWFNGACVTHWSSGGYMFCSEACVVHHRKRMAAALVTPPELDDEATRARMGKYYGAPVQQLRPLCVECHGYGDIGHEIRCPACSGSGFAPEQNGGGL